MTKPTAFMLVMAVVCFALDQASKIWVTQGLGLGWDTPPYDVVAPYLRFVYAENCGINFGLFSDCSRESALILIAISVVVSVALGIWAMRRNALALSLGAGAVIGGALGNALDRELYGAVIDFLNMSCCGIHNPFSFNIADVAIFGGAIWIAFRA